MREYRGIKKAAGETKHLDGWNGRVQINYDPSDKTVWADYFPEVNSWKRYHDPDIISIFTRHPMTMIDIKNAIGFELSEIERYEAEMAIENSYNLEYRED